MLAVYTAPPGLPLVLAEIPAAPVLGVMTFALVITLMGHINKNYKTVAVGIALLFIATGAMMLAAYIDYAGGQNGDPGAGDPRPCNTEIPGNC